MPEHPYIPPETLGEFRLYPPVPGGPKITWSLAHQGDWLYLRLADRDACLLVMGVYLCGGWGCVHTLERYQLNKGSYPLTVPEVLLVMEHFGQ